MTLGQVTVKPKDATRQAGAGAGQRLILMGCASNAPTSGRKLQRHITDANLEELIGYGLLTEVASKVLGARGDQLIYALPADTEGAITSVSVSPSGPQLGLTGNPTGKFAGRMKVTKGGATDSGTARVRFALDGYTYGPDVQVMPRTAAELVGTVDLTTLTYGPGGDLDGLVLPIESDTSGGAINVTFTAPASANVVVSLINTAGGGDFVADIVAGRYLRIRSATIGSVGTIALRGGGDAYAALGFGEPVEVTPAAPATITGTVSLTSGALFGNGGTLDTLTFIATSDSGGPHTTTFVDPANASAVDAQITADAAGDYVPSINGSTQLVIESASVGASATLTIGNGTANAALGFTNGQSDTGEDATYSDEPEATGTNSTYLIPGTGLTATFPAGTWILNEVYTFATTAPSVSVASYQTAIESIPRDGSVKFSAIAIIQDWIDVDEAYNYITALGAAVGARQASEPYQAIGLVVGLPLGGTGLSAQATNDTACRVKFAAVTDEWIWAAHGDCYPANGFKWLGKFRHSALTAKLIQMVTLDESQSIGERKAGAVNGIDLTGPDGATLARDEWTATIEMEDRFSVLCQEKGAAFFKTGRTMATSPGFNELTWLRPFYHAMQASHDQLRTELEATPPLDPGGFLIESVAKSIDHSVQGVLDIEILNPPGARRRASACFFVYDRANKLSDTKSLPGVLTFQTLGIAHNASIAANMVSEIT